MVCILFGKRVKVLIPESIKPGPSFASGVVNESVNRRIGSILQNRSADPGTLDPFDKRGEFRGRIKCLQRGEVEIAIRLREVFHV